MAYVDRATLRMAEAEVVEYLRSHRWGRLATVNDSGEPHVTPVGYVSLGLDIYLHTLVRSRRAKDIERGSRLCMCVDDGVGEGEGYTDRSGVVVYGSGRRMDPAEPQDASILERLRPDFMKAFPEANGADLERRTHGWFELKADRHVSWDFSRIPAGADWLAKQQPAARARNS